MWTSALSWKRSWKIQQPLKKQNQRHRVSSLHNSVWKNWLSPLHFFFFKFLTLLFVCPASLLCGLFSSCREWGLLSSCCAQASQWCGFSSFRAWATGFESLRSCHTCAQELRLLGSGAQAQSWRGMGLVALRHVESYETRDWTCVSWIGRWILYHWTTREAP